MLEADVSLTVVKEFVEEAFNFAGFHRSICRWEGYGKDLKYYHADDLLMEVDPKFYRPAEVDLLWGDSARARKELGWEPKTSFIQLVNKMVKHDMELLT